MQIRRLLSSLFPSLARLYRRILKWRIERTRRRFGKYSVAEAFSEIYRSNTWGSAGNGPFCSGDGSNDEFTDRYVELVASFVREKGLKQIVDIGCGDYRVGSKLVAAVDAAYTGFDVVPALIEYNAATFGGARVNFVCGDAIEDQLPDGDICLVRQVLQHLSNAQVAQIMAKVASYPYVLVTEDIDVGHDAVPNVDKPHGPDTRWVEHSGIYLDLPPFNLPVRTLMEMAYGERAVIRTVLVDRSATVITANR